MSGAAASVNIRAHVPCPNAGWVPGRGAAPWRVEDLGKRCREDLERFLEDGVRRSDIAGDDQHVPLEIVSSGSQPTAPVHVSRVVSVQVRHAENAACIWFWSYHRRLQQAVRHLERRRHVRNHGVWDASTEAHAKRVAACGQGWLGVVRADTSQVPCTLSCRDQERRGHAYWRCFDDADACSLDATRAPPRPSPARCARCERKNGQCVPTRKLDREKLAPS